MPSARKTRSVSIEEQDEDNPLPIDRGWAWVICAASFGVFIILSGSFKTHGMVLVELEEEYPEASATSLLWVVNGCNFCSRLTGPILGLILSKVTHRTGLVIGLSMIALSSSMLGYLPSVEYMYPFYTLMFGFGAGLTSLTCYSATPPYFRKRRGLAIAITASGAGGGSLVTPIVLRFLYDNFNFSSAMLLYGGFVMQGLILAMLLRPISFYEKLNAERSHGKDTCTSSDKLSDKTTNIADEIEVIYTEPGGFVDDQPSLLFHSTNDFVGSISLSPAPNDSNNNDTCISKVQNSKEFMGKCKLFFNPSCLILGCMAFLFGCGLAVILPCLPPLGKDNGISKDLIALLLTTSGLVEIPCRLFNGYIADKNYISCTSQLSICLLLSSMGALLCALISGIAGFIIMILTYSAFCSSIFSLLPLAVVERLGRENLTTVLGIVYCFEGLGITVATFSAGGIYETTHRWENVFLYSFGCTLLSCSICSLYSFYNFYKRNQTAYLDERK